MTHDSLTAGRAGSWLLIVTGAISIIAGALAIAYPDITLLALALIAGINILLFGVMSIVRALSGAGEDAGARALFAVVGILGVLAGLVVIRRPGETLLVVLLAVGLWLIVSGLISGVVALTQHEDRGPRLLAALVDIVLGGLLLALPELSLGTVAVLCGISFLLRGVFAVYAGFKLRGDPTMAAAPAA